MNLYILGGLTGGLGKALWIRFSDSVAVGRRECEVTSNESVSGWVSCLEEDDGPIHVINLTGISRSAMLHKGQKGDWDDMLDINLHGNARLLKFLRPVFKTHPGSSFTMIGSVTTALAPAGTAIYTATKAALEALARVAAREFAPFGRVNVIQLGYCDVGIIKQVNTEALIPTIPLGRLGTAADLAEAWKFCMNCQYLTGATVPVNGGLA